VAVLCRVTRARVWPGADDFLRHVWRYYFKLYGYCHCLVRGARGPRVGGRARAAGRVRGGGGGGRG